MPPAPTPAVSSSTRNNVKENAERLAESEGKLSESNTMKSLIEMSFNATK